VTLLSELGVDAVYGPRLDGCSTVDVPVDLAPLFADAHRRIAGRPAAFHDGGGTLLAPATSTPWVVPAPVDPWPEPSPEVVEQLAAVKRPVVLAGPGVVEAKAVPGLHAFAVAAGVGVLNTWGAKGVFDWRSRHHLATVGLQARDFELGGLAEADLIVATGIDDREARAEWRLAPVLELDPRMLGPVAERWSRPVDDIETPPLRVGLATVTQAGWQASRGPLPPTKLTQHGSQILGSVGGLVTADPGAAGFWVARTFGTQGVGGAQVPADPSACGFALAAAIVARRLQPGRPVLTVLDELTGTDVELLELARRLGVELAVEVWSPDGPPLDSDEHRDRLANLVRTGGVERVGYEPSQMDEIVSVAGPIVAWT
jgi:hypothetical protein